MVFERVAQHVGWPFTDQRQEADNTGHYIVREPDQTLDIGGRKNIRSLHHLCLEDELIVYNLICLNSPIFSIYFRRCLQSLFRSHPLPQN